MWIASCWRYQRGNQNPYIEAEQTTRWPKEKVQEDKQRSTKHTHKTKDRVTKTSLKTGVNSIPAPLTLMEIKIYLFTIKQIC